MPYINGVNSVRVISILADVELSLAIKAIRHLLYYGCIFLLDIFSFSAIYAPTAQFGSTIASDEGMQQECARYVNTRFAPVPLGAISGRGQSSNSRHRPGSPRSSDGTNGSVPGPPGAPHPDIEDIWPLMGEEDDNADHDHRHPPDDSNSSTRQRRPRVVDGVGLVELYAALKQGQSVKQWYLQHSAKLANIDVRRFIAFGIIKGFLYRVHKYAYGPRPPGFVANNNHNSNNSAAASAAAASRPRTPASTATPHEADDHRPTGSSSLQSTPGAPRQDDYRPQSQQQPDDQSTITDVHTEVDDFENDPINRALEKYLDGQHCFDEICTELQISERELTARLKAWPWEVQIIHR